MLPKFNVMILGDAAVGKTSLINNVANKPHQARHLRTVAVDFIMIEYKHEDGTMAQAKIWDTAGQERFRNITKSFYQQADGMIIAFDTTTQKSFLSVRQWILSIFKAIGQNSIPLVLVGNKIDLVEQRVVQKCDIDKTIQEFSLNYHETSAVTGEGVKDMIQDIMR